VNHPAHLPAGYDSTVARLAAIGALLVCVILFTSAYLRLSGIGLGCADWPACYGRAEPAAHQRSNSAGSGTEISAARAVHRMAAILTGLLVLVLLYRVLDKRPAAPGDTVRAVALLVLTVGLALLGRWTTASRVPAVALGNLLGGMTMLALLWWTWLGHRVRGAAPPLTAGPRRLARAGLALLVLQIALGGLASAKLADLGCTTLPACDGHWWKDEWSLAVLNPFTALPDDALSPAIISAPLQMLHRIGALAVLVILGWLAASLVATPGHRPTGIALIAALALQAALGAALVLGGLPLAVALAHHANAALLLLLTLHINHGMHRA
jgi:heme a synthase